MTLHTSETHHQKDILRKYGDDYNNNPPNSVSFVPTIVSTSGKLLGEFVRLLFLQVHWETDRFFTVSGVHLPEQNRGLFHFHHTVFSTQLIAKVDCTLVKVATLHVNLNLDGSPITSRTVMCS